VIAALGIAIGTATIGGDVTGPVVGTFALGAFAAAFAGVGVAIAGLWRSSWAAPTVALLTILTWFVDTIVPAFKLPDVVHQLALSAHYGLPMLGRWDVAGLTASAVLAVGGVVTTVAVHPRSATRSPERVTQQPPITLMAAVAASDGISYRVKVTEATGRSGVTTTEGAFDPATATGYLGSKWSGADVVYYERLVAGTRYIGSSGAGEWKQVPGRFDRLGYDRSNNGHVAGSAGASADPEELLAELRDAGSKITESRPGVFHFELALKPETTPRTTLSQSIAGDVTLGADKRIATIVYTRTTKATKDKVSSTETTRVTMAFSGYGSPVRVEKPADVVAAK